MAINPQDPKIIVVTATSQTQAYSDSCHLNLDLPVTDAHIITGFQNYLLGIGKFFDEDYKVLFTNHSAQVVNPDSDTILTRRHGPSGPLPWRFFLLPQDKDEPSAAQINTTTTAATLSSYYLTHVEALVRFYHASSGFPAKSTRMRAIKSGNYTSWPGLMASSTTKYCTDSIDTKKVHMTQTRQGLCSTNPKCGNPTPAPPL